MLKDELIQSLEARYNEFIQYLLSLSEERYSFSLNNQKWTAGQECDHLIRSTRPLVLALWLPRWILKMVFGKANRPSRSYDEVILKYNNKLQQGGRASGRFIPRPVPFMFRDKACSRLGRVIHRLNTRLDTWNESDLDQYILPHPLLGKLTMREMMYFTIHHAVHHQKNSIRNLADFSQASS